MSANLYETSVPVFLRYLERLSGLVSIAESYAAANSLDLLQARLASDMLPFERQVQVAANFALRTCFPLASQAVPPYGDFPATYEGLQSGISRVKTLLLSLQASQFASAESRVIHDGAGRAMVSLPGAEFLSQYALPNFYFHLVTAYAILRNQGAPLGKEHFDGFHSYPATLATSAPTPAAGG